MREQPSGQRSGGRPGSGIHDRFLWLAVALLCALAALRYSDWDQAPRETASPDASPPSALTMPGGQNRDGDQAVWRPHGAVTQRAPTIAVAPDHAGRRPNNGPHQVSAEQRSLWKALSDARHAVDPLTPREVAMERNRGVRFFATNPGQDITARFLDDGARIESGHPGGGWRALLRLEAMGRSASLLPVGPANVTADSRRVEYHRAQVTEWYENREDGFEHGLTVAARPPAAGSGGPLRIVIALEGVSARPAVDPRGPGAAIELVTPGGTPVLRYGDIKAWDSRGTPVDAAMRAEQGRVILTVADAGAAYPLTIDPLIVSLEQKLGPGVTGDGAGGDWFGRSAALDGNTAVLGVPYDNTAAGASAGSAHVFIRNGEGWYWEGKLSAADGTTNDYFGASVSVSGDTAIVGSYGDDTGAGQDSGSAYVFIRVEGIWGQQAKLTAGDGAPADQFGRSVSADGDTAMIGASRDDAGAGSAYAFVRTGTNWGQQAKLTAGDRLSNDAFGSSVALDGDTALVGAPDDSTAAATSSGSAYVFVRGGGAWNQRQKLTASDPGQYDHFGASVALDGATALVGAKEEGWPAGSDFGAAYVFVRGGSTWSQQAKLASDIGGEDREFGRSVALSGDTALVGAPYAGVSGSAFAFIRSGTAWGQQAILTPGDGGDGDEFGYAVALDQDTALVGAPGDDIPGVGEVAGSAYVLLRSGTNWTQDAKLVSGDGAVEDHFGWSVALADEIALVGNPADDTAAGIDAGSVHALAREGSVWRHQAKLAAGDGADLDLFGMSVAISGNHALAGAVGHAVSGQKGAGAVYFFTRDLDEWDLRQKLVAADPGYQDRFGWSVAADGATAVIGAPDDDVGGRGDAGSAYVFAWDGSSWLQQAKVVAADGGNDDHFGYAVSLDGETALVGAYWDDTPAGRDAGSAYVFERVDGDWLQQAKLGAGNGSTNDNFGCSVALSGSVALVGASRDDTPAGADAGGAYLFRRGVGGWSQQEKLAGSEAVADGIFGSAVAVRGEVALVGAPGKDTLWSGNPGRAFLFRNEVGGWTEVSKIEAADGSARDWFGASLALDGDTALVGASRDDNIITATGDLARDQGSVYVFRLPLWAEIAVHNGPRATDLALADGQQSPVDFGFTGEGTPVARSFTIANGGTAELTVGAVSGPDGYTVLGAPAAPVAAGGGCATFQLRLDAANRGAHSGIVAIGNDDLDESPFEFPVTGRVLDAGYFAWATAAGLGGADVDPMRSPASDGIANLLKFACNLNPLVPDRRMLGTGAGDAGLPCCTVGDGGAVLRLEFLRRRGASLAYSPQKSPDLVTWEPMVGVESVIVIDPHWERVIIEETLDPATTPRLFGRIEVALP